MSILSNILEKLGLKKPAAPAAGAAKPAGLDPTKFKPAVGAPQGTGWASLPPKPVPMQMVDVVSKLDGLAKKSPIKLDWKVSINDLMALLGMKHTAQDIKDLAVELGCPASEMDDSYKRNVWTHKALLKKIAENGGNIPASLLD